MYQMNIVFILNEFTKIARAKRVNHFDLKTFWTKHFYFPKIKEKIVLNFMSENIWCMTFWNSLFQAHRKQKREKLWKKKQNKTNKYSNQLIIGHYLIEMPKLASFTSIFDPFINRCTTKTPHRNLFDYRDVRTVLFEKRVREKKCLINL